MLHAQFNPGRTFAVRLRQARMRRGWAMHELVARTGGLVSIMALSKYEHAIMAPSEKVFAALCEALELSAEFFLKEVSRFNHTALYRSTLAITHFGSAEQRYAVEEYFARHAELEDLMGAPEAKPLWKGIPGMNVYSRADECAEEARRAMGLGRGPIDSMVGLLERLGILVWLYEVPKKFEGSAGTCGPRLVVVLNKSFSRGTVRVRAAMELAHIVWEKEFEEFPQSGWESLREKLARAFLMPREDFCEMLGVRRRHVALQEIRILADYYGVTGEAVIARAADVGCVAESTAMRMRLAWIKICKATGEAEARFSEEPRRFELLLRRAMAENLIPLEKIQELAEGIVPDLAEQEILK